jgi:hypothetical protein
VIAAVTGNPPPEDADFWFAHLHGAISNRPIVANVYPQCRPGFTYWVEAGYVFEPECAAGSIAEGSRLNTHTGE